MNAPEAPRIGPLSFADLGHYQWLQLPVWVFDTEQCRIPWANPAALSYWRADSPSELQQRDFSDASPAVRTRLAAAMAAHAEGRTTREVWTLYPRGVPMTSVLIGRAITLPDQRVAILYASEPLAASFDPTALRGIEAMQHTSVRVALHQLDNGAALMRNPAAVTAFGPLTASGRHPLASMFVEPALARRVLEQARKGQTFSGEAQLNTLRGPRWHGLDVRPVLDPVSGAAAVQVNARDISDLKASQQALEAARDAAEAASRAKSAFLANMSHEIRTPMNGVLGLTELVLATPLQPRQREFLELVRESAQSLMTIINDILDLSKIEAQRLTLEPAPFSLRELLHTSLAPHAVQAQKKGLAFSWQVDEAVPDRFLGDALRVRQVLTNLVSNAIKFADQGLVEVHLRTGATPGCLLFTVADTGIGMSAEQIAHIFEPFTQADASITRRFGGTGLGLSIVRRLVQLMNGRLQVHSTPGVGSRFECELPLPVAD